MAMTRQQFIDLLKQIYGEGEIAVHEQVEMTDGYNPLLDKDGIQIIQDVVILGDGRLYIDRDGNEYEAEQALIDLLANFYDFLPEMIAGLDRQEREA